LKVLRNQVGSYYPRRDNFHLTPYVKAKFTVKAMDSRVKNISRIRTFPSPEAGLRAMAERAPQAEALAASWIEPLRPLGLRVYALRRRIATVAVAVATLLLFVHVMFGANGMVIYKQKRAEYQSLQKKIVQVQDENAMYERSVHALKSDEKAIEKEAREQLRYARPGEFVYVPPAPPAPPVNSAAKK
jgi:cell division protein FtsB